MNWYAVGFVACVLLWWYWVDPLLREWQEGADRIFDEITRTIDVHVARVVFAVAMLVLLIFALTA